MKLPKITWIKYRDHRVFDQDIKHVTVSKTRSGKYFASMLIEIEQDVKSKPIIDEEKIVAFDMSASNFLITKEFRLTNPRFYQLKKQDLKACIGK